MSNTSIEYLVCWYYFAVKAAPAQSSDEFRKLTQRELPDSAMKKSILIFLNHRQAVFATCFILVI